MRFHQAKAKPCVMHVDMQYADFDCIFACVV